MNRTEDNSRSVSGMTLNDDRLSGERRSPSELSVTVMGKTLSAERKSPQKRLQGISESFRLVFSYSTFPHWRSVLRSCEGHISHAVPIFCIMSLFLTIVQYVLSRHPNSFAYELYSAFSQHSAWIVLWWYHHADRYGKVGFVCPAKGKFIIRIFMALFLTEQFFVLVE